MTPSARLIAKAWLPASGLTIALLLTSCGGSDSPSASPVAPTTTTPSAPAPVPRLIQQGGFTLSKPTGDGLVYYIMRTISDPASGRWDATVDWTFGTNTLWMWVSSACTQEQFDRPECPWDAACPCQFSVRSETSTPKPRLLTIANAPGGTRTLFVMNLGPSEESGNYSVTLTPSTSATAQSAASVASGPERAEAPIERLKAIRRPR